MRRVPLTILSHPPLPIQFWARSRIAYVLGLRRAHQRISGPTVVRTNLRLGLQQARIPFRLDPPLSYVTPLVGVLSNIGALRWAITAKERQSIERLVAGPNLVVTPDDEDWILQNPAIDTILTPSRWVSELYVTVSPHLRDKLIEWPVGIDTEIWKPRLAAENRKLWVIYDKTYGDGKAEVAAAVDELNRRHLRYQIIKYGEYDLDDYYHILTTCAGMMFFSPSESQGIAQFEAWACDVPTLVWDRHRWTLGARMFANSLVSSSPYLDDTCGLRFTSIEELPSILDKFLSSLGRFTPRKYVLKHFTLVASAQNYASVFRTYDN